MGYISPCDPLSLLIHTLDLISPTLAEGSTRVVGEWKQSFWFRWMAWPRCQGQTPQSGSPLAPPFAEDGAAHSAWSQFLPRTPVHPWCCGVARGSQCGEGGGEGEEGGREGEEGVGERGGGGGGGGEGEERPTDGVILSYLLHWN